MATIVLVHGIAQEQRSAETLEARWLPDLAGGLRVAGHPDLADRIVAEAAAAGAGGAGPITVRMAFYGDLFRPAGREIQGAGGGETPDDPLVDALAQEWLGTAARRSSDPAERAGAEAELARAADAEADTQGVGGVQRRAVAWLSRSRFFARAGFSLAERTAKSALGQVRRYLSEDEVRAAALARVTPLLDEGTVVLIGHSLGSVVAYEAAQGLGRPLPLLVTLGSPLGLRNVVYERVRPQPPGYPPQVGRWVNVADDDDVVAADPDLRQEFPPPPGRPPLEGYLIHNGAQPHDATAYLTAREVGAPIGEALRAAGV